MEFTRRAAAPADADADYSPPDPSPHGQMTMDTLRRELLKESIRQEVISAELAERRRLEAEVRRRELGLYCDMTTHAGPSMSRRSVKDRIEEWYRPPWHDRTEDEDDASFNWAMVHKKVFSGVKRKRAANTAERNNKKIFGEWQGEWSCSICQAKCIRESDLQNHLRGRRHQENMEALQREDKETDAKFYEKKAPQLAEKNKNNCRICKVNCTSESDLENHLRGRRHQQNVEAQCLEGRKYKSGNGQCII